MSSVYSGGALSKEDQQDSRHEGIVFTATGGEYFRIWIVNLLLTIVTLGVYSAWAKVRRNQYFYANTRLAGGGFEYHASPRAILKGRAIAAMLFGAYNVALKVSETAGFVMLLVLLAVMPWLIWKSLQFALHNSSYRGIRFGFGGDAKGVYFHYLLLPLLSVITLGLLFPFAHQRIKRFQHTQSRFGSVPFGFDAPVGGFYARYLLLFGLLFGGFAVIVGLPAVLAYGSSRELAVGVAVLAGVFVFYPFMLGVISVFLATLQNLIWNHTRLGAHRFSSTMKPGRIAFIAITNTLGIIFTLGLFTPFATVRALKYRLECTALLVEGSLDDITAGQREHIAAVGDGAADLSGFDLAL